MKNIPMLHECFSMSNTRKTFFAHVIYRSISFSCISLSRSLMMKFSLWKIAACGWKREREKKVAHKYKSTTNNYTAHRIYDRGDTRNESERERERMILGCKSIHWFPFHVNSRQKPKRVKKNYEWNFISIFLRF